eukprot:gene15153-12587_t
MAQAFTGDGELKEGDIPSAAADLGHVTNGDFRELLEAFETDISYTPVEQIQAHKYLLNLREGENIFSRTDGFINENEQIRTQDFVKRIKYANKIGIYAQYRRSDDDSKCPWHDSVITIDDVQKPDSGLKYPAFIRDDSNFLELANDLYQCKTCQDTDPHNQKSKQEKSHLVYDPVHCPNYSTSGGNGKWTKVGGNSTKRKYSGSGPQTSKRSTTWQADIECRNKPCHTEGCKFKHSTGKSTQRQQPTDSAMLAQIKTLTETVTALAEKVDKMNG